MKSSERSNPQPLIRGISVTKSFDGKDVIKDLDFEIPLGTSVFIRGASGVGKTTLLRIIAGLEAPSAGTIQGTDGRRIAFLFQEDRLLPWVSVKKNVQAVITDKAKHELAKTLLDELGIGDTLDLYPAQLSGGMKRRVAIARTLAYDADIVILDEAMQGLDAETAKKTAAVIKKYTKGKTLITVSHTPSSIEEACDQTLCL